MKAKTAPDVGPRLPPLALAEIAEPLVLADMGHGKIIVRALDKAYALGVETGKMLAEAWHGELAAEAARTGDMEPLLRSLGGGS